MPYFVVFLLHVETPPLKSYKMRSNPRGKCIILNNVSFHNKANDRCGAELDEDVLEDVFKELDFDVLVRRDLTRNEMQKFTEEVAGQDHSVFDAFVYVIMSHGGNRDIIYGVDGKTIRIEDLMSEFIARNCPSLQNKPKLFFIQACRGSSPECMFSLHTNRHIDSVPIFTADSTLARGACPNEADFLLAFAAAPGYFSYRHEESGSLFIQVSITILFSPVSLCHFPSLDHMLT